MISPTLDTPRLTIPFGPWPYFATDEVESAAAVLRSGKVNFWTGIECKEFEKEYANALGASHVIAAANGTVTLEMALKVLGVCPGDEVIVSPRSFIASVSCVITAGARPVFADVDRNTGNITAATIEAVLTPKTRAIIPVHLAGWPCEMDAIMALAQEHGLHVIEDCAQAHGATYRGRAVGTLGNVGSYSFCQDKIITTGGEGGLLVTNNHDLWSRLWSLKEHGKSYDACFHRQWPPGFRWLHESFGSNHRMTEMQAAIGRRALSKLPKWISVRRRHSEMLSDCLSRLPVIRVPEIPEHIGHARYKYYCYVEAQGLKSGWSRDRIMSEISGRGVPCFSGSCSEIYLEKAFEQHDLRPKQSLPTARELGETSLMFLVHPTIREESMAQAVDVIGYVLKTSMR